MVVRCLLCQQLLAVSVLVSPITSIGSLRPRIRQGGKLPVKQQHHHSPSTSRHNHHALLSPSSFFQSARTSPDTRHTSSFHPLDACSLPLTPPHTHTPCLIPPKPRPRPTPPSSPNNSRSPKCSRKTMSLRISPLRVSLPPSPQSRWTIRP